MALNSCGCTHTRPTQSHSNFEKSQSTKPAGLVLPSYYKMINRRNSKILPCMGCYQLPFRLTLRVVTRYKTDLFVEEAKPLSTKLGECRQCNFPGRRGLIGTWRKCSPSSCNSTIEGFFECFSSRRDDDGNGNGAEEGAVDTGWSRRL